MTPQQPAVPPAAMYPGGQGPNRRDEREWGAGQPGPGVAPVSGIAGPGIAPVSGIAGPGIAPVSGIAGPGIAPVSGIAGPGIAPR
ncbi:hypothetical protein ACH442_02335, partial [Actinoplanes sp. NPDC020271]